MKTHRNISKEIVKSISDFKRHKKGKLTLKTYSVPERKLLKLSSKDIIHIRERFHMSRPLFAKILKIPPRSLERWEQGISRPNRQAVILLYLVKKYPDMLSRIEKI